VGCLPLQSSRRCLVSEIGSAESAFQEEVNAPAATVARLAALFLVALAGCLTTTAPEPRTEQAGRPPQGSPSR
jgi:hypothetical protein